MVLLNNSYSNLTAELGRRETTNKNLDEKQTQLQKLLDSMTKERMDFQKAFQDCQQKQWVCFGGSAYYISGSMKSWNESRDDCQQRGADLVIINSKEEQEFARKFRLSIWIGLTDTEAEGTWKWVDGTLLNTSYWDIKEPNSKNEHEDCAEIHRPDLKRNWNDESCDKKNFWICEKKLTL
ncbi:C-type lectin domain family 4 member M-like [Mugil cephalus]|uniref:C-type lectin domain family 4 member M-like n=1 Tax=Mugil cephalus TaxID=48193 RepID=UPI001FB779A3|nr:C-type lectin domain family 4 member M-like [Mugil cephalus]